MEEIFNNGLNIKRSRKTDRERAECKTLIHLNELFFGKLFCLGRREPFPEGWRRLEKVLFRLLNNLNPSQAGVRLRVIACLVPGQFREAPSKLSIHGGLAHLHGLGRCQR